MGPDFSGQTDPMHSSFTGSVSGRLEAGMTFRRHVTPIIPDEASKTKRMDLQRMADELNDMFARDCFYSAEAALAGARKSLERHPNMSPAMFAAGSRPNQ